MDEVVSSYVVKPRQQFSYRKLAGLRGWCDSCLVIGEYYIIRESRLIEAFADAAYYPERNVIVEAELLWGQGVFPLRNRPTIAAVRMIETFLE